VRCETCVEGEVDAIELGVDTSFEGNEVVDVLLCFEVFELVLSELWA
jgi:hypothetical protein